VQKSGEFLRRCCDNVRYLTFIAIIEFVRKLELGIIYVPNIFNFAPAQFGLFVLLTMSLALVYR
jgi:hypothetical protein